MPKTALEKLAAATVPAFERHEPRPNVAFDMSRAELVDEKNHKLDWDVFSALKEAPLTLTMTGASEVRLVLEDPLFELLNDPIFAQWMFKEEDVSLSSGRTYAGRRITDSKKAQRYGEESELEWILPERPIDLNLDGVWFRLAGFETKRTTLTLIFEDRVAAQLREKLGFTTVNRGDMTRAQFIHKQIREAERKHGHIEFFCPEENIVQPVAESSHAESAGDLKSSAQRSLGEHDGITVKGQPANGSQLQLLNEALEEAVEIKAPFKAQVALVAALIDENTVSESNPGTPFDRGPLSLIDSTVAATHINPYSVKAVSLYFLTQGFSGHGGAKELALTQSHLTPGEIAHLVQGNANPEAYKPWVAEAERAVRAYGQTGSEAEGEQKTPGPYAFTRGPNETVWDSLQRLASEVSWYVFIRDNAIWYVSGNFLLKQTPHMHVERGLHGIDWVDPHIDIGARDNIAEIAVEGRAAFWTAVSGAAVSVGRVGPANGRWCVNTINLNVLDRSDKVTIKLQKPLPARPEPASGTAPVGVNELEGSAARGAEPGSPLAVFYAYNTLSEMQLPYVYGGGHGQGALAKVRKGGEGLDCSSSTCWALHQGGMFPSQTAQTSGELENWGEAGEGKEMTVWANAEHAWIEFKIPGHAHARGDTVGAEGPRLQSVWPPPEGTSGFTPRHWPGA
jgi:hypothetical protein